jgi:tetratricopeptide (TPR) repeat protein
LGLRLAAVLSTFWLEHGHLIEGRRWLDAFLALPAPADMEGEVLVAAHEALARLAESQGDSTTALRHAQMALSATGSDERRAEILLICAMAERHRAAYSAAEEQCVTALGIFRRLGHARGIAMALKQLGILCKEHEDWARAITLFEESLSNSKASDDLAQSAKTLTSLGVAHAVQGLNERAMACHMESLRISRQHGDVPAIADVLLNIGHLAAMQQDFARARAAWEESADMFRSLGDKVGLCMALLNQAEALVRSGNDGPATTLCLEGLTLAAETNRVRSVISGLELAAVVLGRAGERSVSVRLLGAAAARRASIGLLVVETDHAFVTSYLDEARRVLGEGAYAADWQHGQRLPVGDAIAAAQTALRAATESHIGGRLTNWATPDHDLEHELMVNRDR